MKLIRAALMVRVALIVVALCAAARAQTPAGAGEVFTSIDGRFAIALPRSISAYGPAMVDTPQGKVAAGDTFTWNREGAQFDVSHMLTPGAPAPAEAKAILERSAKATADELATSGGKLVAERAVRLAGQEGREMRFDVGGREAVYRFYVVGSHAYRLTATYKPDEAARASAARVLDSFRLLSDEEVAAARRRKVAEATPDPLPQEPAARKLKTDAEDEGLRGKVKTVLVEREELSGASAAAGRRPTRMDYYDARGHLTKTELFDSKGNVFQITVYGYLDGERASAQKTVRNDYDPPAPAAPPAAADAPKRDPRFQYKYRYAYDERGRLAEKILVDNAGETTARHAYEYEGDRRVTSVYTVNRLLVQKSSETFDAKGNTVEESQLDVRSDKVRVKYSYTYEGFDAQGNWTKRTTSRWVERDGQSAPVPTTVTHRTITYY